MKTLIVMRHARAEPDSPSGDFARKLTPKGIAEATAGSGRIASLELRPDRVVTSGAARALATAEIAASRLDALELLVMDDRIYDAEFAALFLVVTEIPDECETVLLVGHNPGVEDFVDQLAAGHGGLAAFTPAAFVVIDISVASWGALGASCGVVRSSWRPE